MAKRTIQTQTKILLRHSSSTLSSLAKVCFWNTVVRLATTKDGRKTLNFKLSVALQFFR